MLYSTPFAIYHPLGWGFELQEPKSGHIFPIFAPHMTFPVSAEPPPPLPPPFPAGQGTVHTPSSSSAAAPSVFNPENTMSSSLQLLSYCQQCWEMQNHLWRELFGRASSPSAPHCFTMGKSRMWSSPQPILSLHPTAAGAGLATEGER